MGPLLAPPRQRANRPLLGQHPILHLLRGEAQCAAARSARASGARFVRADFYWSVIERVRGRFDWRLTDRLVAVAAQHGLIVLPILAYPPRWAARTTLTLPRQRSPYARFVSRVVARYGPRGVFWRRNPRLARATPRHFELWNEPYQPWFSGGRPDPAVYAKLVRSAVSRGRAANPRARFILAGEAVWATPSGALRNWMEDMYSAVPGLGRYFDAVSVHPYSGGPPEFWDPRMDIRGQSRRLELVRSSLLRHGDGAKHLWVTEIGWPTCSGRHGCISEQSQADYLRSFFGLWRSRWRRYVDVVVGYELRDNRRPDQAAWEGHYGLLRPDGGAKPGWHVFRAQR